MSLNPLEKLPDTPLKIQRALISLSDKRGLEELVKLLHSMNIEIISTGGTADAIRREGIPVMDVREVTGHDECLDGRVKTLHPSVHGGILARTSHPPDLVELEKLGIQPIELVVVNLYPFSETISKADVNAAVATENIDIGGPTMIRAAAKNFAHVCVLSSPEQYSQFAEELKTSGEISFKTRRSLAKQAFEKTAGYDVAISHYFNELEEIDIPDQITVSLPKTAEMRYGENPHQNAAVYGTQSSYIHCFHGKELSYNNYLDIDSALQLMADFSDSDPTAAILKHTVPCGIATRPVLSEAYHRAFQTDKVSPFGGIVIVNNQLDMATAEAIDSIFTEIVLAPDFAGGVAEFLMKKTNRRLIRILKFPGEEESYRLRSVFGGVLCQQPDLATVSAADLTVVTKRKPTEEELRDMLFAWKVVKHVKSNAIVYAKNESTCGIGTGQTSRVDSSVIAVRKAMNEELSLKGSVVASDAFFPFPDGVIAAAHSGSTAVIQPGGSVRDAEVIKAADEYNMAMAFTGIRHFKH
ncbi:MAG: bifunctional phosphoribosylaminoimidazolecarboxamide formyltransferase/IMP cyclohydrolase PurH [Balneolaceae bacterium]|nr:MAG: bifunctional phosphoribosylaminoimidazolecarboxamide formyltransferase/IMP cyclohydrolase PurH [Balneolaceae bacterium]